MKINSEKFFFLFYLLTDKHENLIKFTPIIVTACIQVYRTICSSLLPTPAKSHYTFNLRDLSKVFQGMLMHEIKSIEVLLTNFIHLSFNQLNQ